MLPSALMVAEGESRNRERRPAYVDGALQVRCNTGECSEADVLAPEFLGDPRCDEIPCPQPYNGGVRFE
jgi:hypothetical protein